MVVEAVFLAGLLARLDELARAAQGGLPPPPTPTVATDVYLEAWYGGVYFPLPGRSLEYHAYDATRMDHLGPLVQTVIADLDAHARWTFAENAFASTENWTTLKCETYYFDSSTSKTILLSRIEGPYLLIQLASLSLTLFPP